MYAFAAKESMLLFDGLRHGVDGDQRLSGLTNVPFNGVGHQLR
jgi:hypothetical protein